MHKFMCLGLSILSLLFSFSTSAGADEPPALREPAAIAELKRATDFLTALPRFHLSITAHYDIAEEDGFRLNYERIGEIYLQRPDRFSADISFDDGRARQYVYDGHFLGIAERSKKVHTQVRAPETIDGTLDMLEGLLKEPQPLADLMYSDLTPLDKNAKEATTIGDSVVGGHACKHLAFRGENADWQVWVEQGDKPYIRKFTVAYPKARGSPKIVATLSTWEIPDSMSSEQFTFRPAADSEWIDMLISMPRTIEEEVKP